MEDKKFSFTTQYGRKTKQQYKNLNFRSLSEERNCKTPKMSGESKAKEGMRGSALTDPVKAQRQRMDTIQRQQEEIEQLQLQIEKQKRELEAQMQRRVDDNTERDRHRDVNEGNWVRQVAAVIEQGSQLKFDIKLPKFENEALKNPVEFLEELEKFCRLKNMNRDTDKMLVIENALEGRACCWFTVNRINDFETFKQLFMEEFYSVPIKIKFKNNWSSRKYHEKIGSLQTYFYSQLKESEYIRPKLSAYETNYIILQQLPVRVRESLAVLDFEKTSLIIRALSQFDDVQQEREQNLTLKSHLNCGQNTYSRNLNNEHFQVEHHQNPFNRYPNYYGRGNDRRPTNNNNRSFSNDQMNFQGQRPISSRFTNRNTNENSNQREIRENNIQNSNSNENLNGESTR